MPGVRRVGRNLPVEREGRESVNVDGVRSVDGTHPESCSKRIHRHDPHCHMDLGRARHNRFDTVEIVVSILAFL